jgi:uncharacterized protein YjbI with pentapeptide repeats
MDNEMIDSHELWLRSLGEKGQQLEHLDQSMRGLSLRGRDLSDCLIAGSDLSDSTLEQCMFVRAKLSSVILGNGWARASSFTKAFFRFARIDSFVFEGCELIRADFSNAELANVRFVDCDLWKVYFGGTQLSSVSFEGCTHRQMMLADTVLDRVELISPKVVSGNLLEGVQVKRLADSGQDILAALQD